jgi:hypothetical protein
MKNKYASYGMLNKKQSDYQKQRAREANLGNKHGLGVVFSNDRKQKISEKLKGNQNYKFRKGGKGSRPDMKGNTFGFKKGILPWNTGKLLVKREERVCECGCGEKFICKVNSTKHFLNRKHIVKTEEHMRNVLKSICSAPNKFEVRALAYLESLYPSRFSFTGDGSVFINGKSPDALDANSRTVALFNGTYWHLGKLGLDNTDFNKRIVEKIESQPFLDVGYKVIFIWEDELI